MRHVFRYLVEEVPSEGGRVTLAPEDAHHLLRVVRRGVGETVEVADGAGIRHRAEVVEAGERVVVRVGERLPDLAPAPVLLGVGLMDAGRLDLVAEKAAELGVAALVVVRSGRVRRTPEPDAWTRRAERLGRVVEAACRQCGRARLMPVEGLVPFAAIVAETPGADGILIDPRGGVALGDALA
ncbi:MAG: RsmE family RNA methyltransferase, partial [Miltoncostaeaceae bacterium]